MECLTKNNTAGLVKVKIVWRGLKYPENLN
jgi:hypothetical protein